MKMAAACDNLTSLALTILMAFLLGSSSFETCSARDQTKHSIQSSTAHEPSLQGRKLSKFTSYAYSGAPEEMATSSAIFNVLSYGAKGDGRTDDTKAFEAAWAAACKIEGATMVVPSGSVFLVGPISFSGPTCQPNILFQLDGKIIAPTNSGAWGSGILQWLEFSKLKGITLTGKGIIDGQGSVWWHDAPSSYGTADDSASSELKGNMPGTKPTALRFYGSSGVTVTGITIQNSQQTHLKFDDCTAVQVSDFTASSPGDSPNTDGIHLQNSQDVTIHSSTLACGDDCVSIQTGCSNIDVHNVNCGPGHGISIGSLGKDNTKACVSNITVRDVTMHDTMTGVRIKTWQGGSGLVQQVTFSNIQVNDVKSPIVIDQYYCEKSSCHNESSAVQVSNIAYVNIRGTYTEQPAHFACSDILPCTGISLSTVALKPVQSARQPFCWEAYGELKTATDPPINCLRRGMPPNAKSHPYSDSCQN